MFFISVEGDSTQGCGCSQASDVVRARTIRHRCHLPYICFREVADIGYYVCSIPNTATTDRNKVV